MLVIHVEFFMSGQPVGTDGELIDLLERTADAALDTSVTALSRMRNVRDAAGGISGAVEALEQAFSTGDAEAVATDTTTLLAAAETAIGRSAKTLSQVDAARLEVTLRRAQRGALELKIVALMVKINAAQMANAISGSNGFVSDLTALVGNLSDTVARAQRMATVIIARIADAAGDLADAAAVLRQQSAVMQALKEKADALLLERNRHLDTFSAEAETVAQACQKQIGRLVPCLQFADAFTQRLHNAKRFMAEAQGKTPLAVLSARDLAARQIVELAVDNGRIRVDTEDALDQMHQVVFRSAQVLTPEGKSDGTGGWLAAAGEIVTRNVELIATLRSSLSASFDKLATADEAMADVASAVREFDALAITLNLVAINGAIAASQSSQGGRAAYLLATEVQSVARNCAAQLEQTRGELSAIQTSLSQVDRDGLAKQLERLSTVQADVQAERDAQHERIEIGRQAQENLAENLTSLMVACRAARETIQKSADMDEALTKMASTLRPAEEVEHSPESSGWIRAFYSTTEERDLHDQILGDEREEVIDPSGDLDDDLEGFVL